MASETLLCYLMVCKVYGREMIAHSQMATF